MALRRKKHQGRARYRRSLDHNGFHPYMVRYLEWGRVSQGVTEDTFRRWENALLRFIEWCDDRGLDDPRLITLPILERYQKHLFYYRKLNGEPLSPGSQQMILAPLKGFFKWLTRERYLDSNPASELVIPRCHRQLPRHILHRDEIERVMAEPDLGTPDGLRDRAILEVLYATGMRRKELCGLQVYDLDMRREGVLIRQGKGGKDRLVPLGPRALHWVKRYLNEVHPLLITPGHEECLFLSDYGEPITRDALSSRVKRLLLSAGVEQEGSCHLFRHACATHMLENGADTRFIQMLLGHDDLNSTQIYTRVSLELLKEVHASTHPSGGRLGREGDESDEDDGEGQAPWSASDNKDRG